MSRNLFIICFLSLTINANAQVNLITLKELNSRIAAGKDTTYVINFWATWCSPCVAELPSFERLHVENADNPLQVILVSLDFKSKIKNIVTPFVANNKITTAVYVINETDQQTFFKAINEKWSGAIPATLFVNHEKGIRSFYEHPFANYLALTDHLKSLKLTP